jgi:hypothetical protein
MEKTIKFKDILLQMIADDLNLYKNHRVCDVEVVFYENDIQVMKRDVPTALNYLVNNIYWDEENNWSGADKAEVRVI